MRSFVAIELPDTIKASLESLEMRLRGQGPRVTWVRPENMHLTLRFLGDVQEAGLSTLGEILDKAYGHFSPFPLTVREVGAFPNTKSPNVLWAGLEPLEGPLAAVQASAEQAACAIGLPPETKPFRPHLTLGRIRELKRDKTPKPTSSYESLSTRLLTEHSFYGGDFTVQAVSLFSSELTSEGPRHTRLREFHFASI